MKTTEPEPLTTADAIEAAFVSRAEANSDDTGPANVADGLYAVARTLDRLADAVERGCERIAKAIDRKGNV